MACRGALTRNPTYEAGSLDRRGFGIGFNAEDAAGTGEDAEAS
jgi:hypothetical protein